jgi:polyisoprenoid-binding protein YceI
MKKLFLTVVAGIVSVATFAQAWSLDKSHANVSFTISHMMISEVDGNFKKFDAKVTSSKDDLSDASLEFSADIAGISTGNEMRDGHLQGAQWFDGAKHPTMTFKSTSFKKVSGETYTIVGNLTMKGVTKPVTLKAIVKGPIDNKGKKLVGIKATGVINRAEFGVGEAGTSPGNEVEFKVAGEFKKD